MCIPSEKMDIIKESIMGFILKEGEPSVLVGEFLCKSFVFLIR